MPELNPQPLPPGEAAWKHPSAAPPWWPQLRQLRQTTEQQLVHAVQNLSKSHDEAMARKARA